MLDTGALSYVEKVVSGWPRLLIAQVASSDFSRIVRQGSTLVGSYHGCDARTFLRHGDSCVSYLAMRCPDQHCSFVW